MAHVLVVDDAADLRLLMRLTLESVGHQVTEADGGTEALPILSTDADIDLVILDVQMPVVDGWEVLTRLRDNPGRAEIPVLLCTVKFSGEDLIRAWSLGCDDYLNKPFDLPVLINMVGSLLQTTPEERRQRRQAEIEALQHSAAAHSN